MSDDAANHVAKRVTYSGHVQGVGFRATASHIARSHPVTGWVRNLPNGHVELWAEGAEAAVETFLAAIRNGLRGFIHEEHIETVTPANWTTFRISR